MAKVKAKKKKKPSVEMTLWGVILSYPDLHDPKPYKGKVYYRTDMLLERDHPQLKELRKAIKSIKVQTWGEDESEYPEGLKKFVQDGNEREDQPTYKDKFFVTASTQTPVPVVDLKGKAFSPQAVKGGMWANVAINISAWEFDGDEGISIYLQGVQIDTTKASLNFGGGRSVAKMFERDSVDADDSDDEEMDTPRGKVKMKDFDDEDEAPKSKKKKAADDEE
jgi:hypothetical protein